MELLDPDVVEALRSSLEETYAISVRDPKEEDPSGNSRRVVVSGVSDEVVYASLLETVARSPRVSNLVLEMPDAGTSDGTMSVSIDTYPVGDDGRRDLDRIPTFGFVEWRRDEMSGRLDESEREDPDNEMFVDRNRWAADKRNVVRLSLLVNNMKKTMNVLSASVTFFPASRSGRDVDYYEISFDHLDKMSYDFLEFLSADEQLGPRLLDAYFSNRGFLTRRVTFVLGSVGRSGSHTDLASGPPLLVDRKTKEGGGGGGSGLGTLPRRKKTKLTR